jgi:hypothetical protein
LVGSTIGKIGFVFDLILQAAYIVGACAFTSIVPSLSLVDMIYFKADTKTTLASASILRLTWIPLVHSVVKRAHNRTARFRCVFGSADACEIWKNWVSLG